jgi:hypothetical protein
MRNARLSYALPSLDSMLKKGKKQSSIRNIPRIASTSHILEHKSRSAFGTAIATCPSSEHAWSGNIHIIYLL